MNIAEFMLANRLSATRRFLHSHLIRHPGAYKFPGESEQYWHTRIIIG